MSLSGSHLLCGHLGSGTCHGVLCDRGGSMSDPGDGCISTPVHTSMHTELQAFISPESPKSFEIIHYEKFKPFLCPELPDVEI